MVNHYNAGFTVVPEDHIKLAESIAHIAEIDTTRKQQNARKYALKYLNIDNVMKRFVEDITDMPHAHEIKLARVA